MEFRYNEIIIWLIPGLYLLCLLCLFVLLPFTDGDEITNIIVSLKDIPEGILTSAALFFIPFVSFVIGYLINYVASQTEFWMYEFNGLNVSINASTPFGGWSRVVILHRKVVPTSISNI